MSSRPFAMKQPRPASRRRRQSAPVPQGAASARTAAASEVFPCAFPHVVASFPVFCRVIPELLVCPFPGRSVSFQCHGGSDAMKMLRPNGARVAEMRAHKGLTQVDCKVDAKTLRKIEAGERTGERTMRRLAEALRVPLEAIVHADEVAAVRELDAARMAWRNEAADKGLILPDRHTQSKRAEMKRLEPIDEGRFVNTIRSAEILKWHMDLVEPSDEKLEYLGKVGDLVDYFRQYVKGVGGDDTPKPRGPFEANKESDVLFETALRVQKKILKLRELIASGKHHGIKFMWIFYTFWSDDRDFAGETVFSEQHVTLVVATDTDREEVFAVIHTGLCPYDEGERYLKELNQSAAKHEPESGSFDEHREKSAGQEKPE
jgi:transcriptional regulator with XRE-family HTH domain